MPRTSFVALGLHDAAARLEHRHRGARPDQHADRHPLGRLGRAARARASTCADRRRSRAPRFHEQTCTWRCAPRIASAIRGSAFAPSISTSIALPSRSGRGRGLSPTGLRWRAPARPDGQGARSRRMWWWIIARSIPSADRRRRNGRAWLIVPPYPLASESWPQITPSRSALPPSVSRCPCSRTIFDPAEMSERLTRSKQRWASRASGTTRRPRRRSAASTPARSAGSRRSRSCRSDAEDLDGLAEMAEEDEDLADELEEAIASVEARLLEAEEQRLFTGDYDAGDALVTVNAGAGGTDAQDWAEMVLRMMMRWAERRGFKVELLEASAGEEAGIKSATFQASRARTPTGSTRPRRACTGSCGSRRSTPPTGARRPSRASRSRRWSRRPATSRSTTTTSRSTPIARPAPAASTSTRPTPRCASPTGRRGSSCSARTSARSRRTARRRWRCCARS